MTKSLRAAIVAPVIAALLASGCSTVQQLQSSRPGGGPSFAAVHPGDHLRLVTRDGRIHRLKVLTVDVMTIRATDNVRYQAVDVISIERRQWDRSKNIILGVSAGVLTVLSILLMRGLCVCTQ